MFKKFKAVICCAAIGACFVTPCFARSTNSNCTSSIVKTKPKASSPIRVTGESLLAEDLECLNLNNPEELTGYFYFRNVSYDPRIAVNPKNPKNIVIATQQDTLTNGVYNGSSAISILVLYSLDGGETWNPSNLVLSRCQGATLYEASDNFISAYFPGVTFDNEGNCYIVSSSYYLFAADQTPDVETDEGNIIAKSSDGGKSWNYLKAAIRDEGKCNFLDFPHLTGDPYREHTVYLVSSDNTCTVSDLCEDPNYTGAQNITFQKTTNGGLTWSDPSIIASFQPVDLSTCLPIPILPHLEVLPDKTNSLIAAAMIEQSEADQVESTALDQLYVWKSYDNGTTWKQYPVDTRIPHVLAVDPYTVDPVLPVTSFTTLDFVVNPCNGYAYIVYSSPMFNPTHMAGCVIRKSTDGGKTWSLPRPVNPNSLDSQAFLPTVAVAKDGTVGVMFYDLRNYSLGDETLNTDVWLTLFDAELKHMNHEVRLTPESFDTRKSIRGYNGIDPTTCALDYYLSSHVDLETKGNDFLAVFAVTNNECPPAIVQTSDCDAFPLTTDECNRQDSVFVHVKRR